MTNLLQGYLNKQNANNWIDSFALGLLQIYIDDFTQAVLTLPLNLGAAVSLDDLSTPNPLTGDVDGYMTG